MAAVGGTRNGWQIGGGSGGASDGATHQWGGKVRGGDGTHGCYGDQWGPPLDPMGVCGVCGCHGVDVGLMGPSIGSYGGVGSMGPTHGSYGGIWGQWGPPLGPMGGCGVYGVHPWVLWGGGGSMGLAIGSYGGLWGQWGPPLCPMGAVGSVGPTYGCHGVDVGSMGPSIGSYGGCGVIGTHPWVLWGRCGVCGSHPRVLRVSLWVPRLLCPTDVPPPDAAFTVRPLEDHRVGNNSRPQRLLLFLFLQHRDPFGPYDGGNGAGGGVGGRGALLGGWRTSLEVLEDCVGLLEVLEVFVEV